MNRRAVADPLDVEDDRLRLLVRAQIFEDVDEADIGLVSATDRLAEADSPLLEVGERLGDVGAALRGEAEVSRPAVQGGDGDIQGDCRVHDSHAVGAEYAHSIGRDDLLEPFLERPPGGAGLPETGADDDRPFRPDLGEIFENRDDLVRRDDKHGEVRDFGKVQRRGVGLMAQDGLLGGVDGIERPLPAVFEEGEGLDRSHFHGIVARAGGGDGSRMKQQVQRMFRHESPLFKG